MHRFSLGALSAIIAIAFTSIGAPDTAAAPDERRPGQLDDPGSVSFDTSQWSTDFDISAVPFREILSGGVGKDGIPALDQPRFESVEAARGWLDGQSPVIALAIDGQARAYPLAILTWHEIVNDVLAGVPVAVTFCPLCHTGLVYDRTLEGRILDFGVSGNLRFSDLVMYDRQTESWWQQATGEGIVGSLTGAKLPFRASQLVSLDQFEQAWPEGDVLSRATGHERDYGRNPYPGYDRLDERPFLFDGVTDGRVAPKERVVTLGGPDGEAISLPWTELRTTGVANIEHEGVPLVVLWAPGTVSALDLPSIDDSEDVGSTGVFGRVVDEQALTFERTEDTTRFRDRETGSSWEITGRAVDGPLAGTHLQSIPHGNHFWFAWAAFVPETAIWTADGSLRLDDE